MAQETRGSSPSEQSHSLDNLGLDDLGLEDADLAALTGALQAASDPMLRALEHPSVRAALIAAGRPDLFESALPILLGSTAARHLDGLDRAVWLHLSALRAWRGEQDLLTATTALNTSLALLETLNDDTARAYCGRVFDTYGQLLHHQGLLLDARAAFERALQWKESIQDAHGIALTQGNLGRLCMALGDFEAATEYLIADLAHVQATTPDATRLISTLLTQLGASQVDAGDVEGAQRTLLQSRALAQAHGDAVSAAFVGVHLARAALRSGRADEAIQHLAPVEALSPDQTAMLPELQGLAAQVRAQGMRAAEDLPGALASFERAQAFFDAAPRVTPVERAELLEAHACAIEASDDPHRAADMLREALRSLDATSADDMRRRMDDHLQRLDRNAWMLHSSGRFVGHGQIDLLLGEAGRGGFRGRLAEASVLFSDLRGFTTFAEALEPETLVDALNRYFGTMTRCVEHFGGRIDKFIGDAVMAIFPPVKGAAAHTDRATRAALFMQAELDRFNRFLPDGWPSLAAGVGVHAGSLIVGLIGSPQKRSYTVLGDVVNIASRLEGMTKILNAPVLITSEVAATLTDETRTWLLPLGRYRPQGRRGFVDVSFVGTAEQASASRAQAEHALERFYARDFQAAHTAFTALAHKLAGRSADGLEGRSADRGFKLHALASEQFQSSPPPPTWDGALVLTEK